MTQPIATSRASKVRRTEALLRALLKTPKSQRGLACAAVSKGLTRSFVLGWLSQHRHDGTVAVLKSSHDQSVMFQMSEHVVLEVPRGGDYPLWLDPRSLPPCGSRQVFISGQPVAPGEKEFR